MLSALLWTLFGMVGLAVAVVLLPLRLRFAAGSAPVAHARVEFSPLGGLLPWIGLYDSTRSGEQPAGLAEEPSGRGPKPPRKRRAGRRPGVDVRRMFCALPDFLGGLLRVFRFDRLEIEGVFGLGDPADTGAAYGMIAPSLMAAGYALGRPDAVRVVPDFGRQALEGRGEAEITVMPARAIAPTVRFLWRVFGPRRWT